ncbi:MAG: hypothetical protein ACNI27_16430 [Desulfovibrio sp.]
MTLDSYVFRGSRNYISGADIIDTFLSVHQFASEVSAYDFIMKIKISHLYECSTTPPESEEIIATFQSGNEKIFFWESDTPVLERVEDDEDQITPLLSVNTETQSVSIPAEIPNCDFHRKCVIAYRLLLNSTVLEGKNCKHVFVRIRLKEKPKGSFSIAYKRLVAGQFYEGVLLDNNKSVGSIFFTAEEVRS